MVLAKSRVNRCLGCFKCTTEESFLHCVWAEKDDVDAVHAKMVEADLIIYASPIYIFAISSLLKAFLERFMSTAACGDLRVTKSGLFFHHINEKLCSKPFAALICCDNMEDDTPHNAVESFKIFSRFVDAPMVGTLVRHTSQTLFEARNQEDQANNVHLSSVMAAYRQAGRELATLGRITAHTEKRAHQSILSIPLPVQWLMKLNLRAVKQEAIKRAQGMALTAPKDPDSAG